MSVENPLESQPGPSSEPVNESEGRREGESVKDYIERKRKEGDKEMYKNMEIIIEQGLAKLEETYKRVGKEMSEEEKESFRNQSRLRIGLKIKKK